MRLLCKVLTLLFLLNSLSLIKANASDLVESSQKLKNPTFFELKKGLLKYGIVNYQAAQEAQLPEELIVALVKYHISLSEEGGER